MIPGISIWTRNTVETPRKVKHARGHSNINAKVTRYNMMLNQRLGRGGTVLVLRDVEWVPRRVLESFVRETKMWLANVQAVKVSAKNSCSDMIAGIGPGKLKHNMVSRVMLHAMDGPVNPSAVTIHRSGKAGNLGLTHSARIEGWLWG